MYNYNIDFNFMKKVQLTQDGFQLLKKELSTLKDEKLPLAIDKLQKARSMGDLKENNAYSSARDELSLMEGRVQEIEEILKNVEIINQISSKDGISIGARVTIEVEGNREQFHIVGEYEADPMNKRVSHTSPIGKALIGRKVGDTIQVEIPSGKINYKIVDIK